MTSTKKPPLHVEALAPEDAAFDPLTPLAPIDRVDAFFKAAQDAIVRGEERVEVTPECHDLAAALRDMYRDGPAAMPRVRAAAHNVSAHLPAVMGAHDDFLDEIADLDGAHGVPARSVDLDTARIMRMSRTALVGLLDALLKEHEEVVRRGVPWPASLAGMTDDQLRAAVRRFAAMGRRADEAGASTQGRVGVRART